MPIVPSPDDLVSSRSYHDLNDILRECLVGRIKGYPAHPSTTHLVLDLCSDCYIKYKWTVIRIHKNLEEMSKSF